jgi:hypothetical protein
MARALQRAGAVGPGPSAPVPHVPFPSVVCARAPSREIGTAHARSYPTDAISSPARFPPVFTSSLVSVPLRSLTAARRTHSLAADSQSQSQGRDQRTGKWTARPRPRLGAGAGPYKPRAIMVENMSLTPRHAPRARRLSGRSRSWFLVRRVEGVGGV